MWLPRVGARPGPRPDTHVRNAPVRPGISPQTPGSMPRAEDDVETWAHSPEFHDRPGSGRHTADRLKFF
jgi:hypothetical protein